jgi:hypothetical protein
MRLVPRALVGKVEFFETKLVVFEENAAAIGLSDDDVDTLRDRAQAARAALDAQQAAVTEARSATQRFNQAVEALGEFGAATIMKVRSTAESTGNPAVYTLAGLPTPNRGSPIASPGRPEQLQTRLDPGGDLHLSWTCANPRGSTGTMYHISRQVGDGPMTYLATVGVKQFTDQTIPQAATELTYMIRAIRSTKTGMANTFNVSFGSNGRKPLPTFIPNAA